MPTREQRPQPCPCLAWGEGPPARQGQYTKGRRQGPRLGREGVLFHILVPGHAGPAAPDPQGPIRSASVCPIGGQAHAEPLAVLLTQEACPIPSFLVNSGYSGSMLSSAPRGAWQG